MAYSGDPSESTVDAVWFLIGDTADPPDISEEEITWLLAEENGLVYDTAARAADQLATKFAGEVTRSMGSLSISAGEKSTKYRDLANSLRAQATTQGPLGAPEFTAQSIAGKQAVEDDQDRVASEGIRIGMHSFGSHDPASGEYR